MNRREALAWGRGDRRRLETRDIPPEVQALVTERQGGRFCEACRASRLETPKGEPLELDHLQPLVDGGDNHHANLRWLCRSHNRGRGARREVPAVPAWGLKPRESCDDGEPCAWRCPRLARCARLDGTLDP